ncbi:macrosialin-like [Engraulis encrasicolus]|uniref:macrosialin-like n=1 Tax=Engraulis encrasicolus TaxID=184585 RepID=UPI002FD11599
MKTGLFFLMAACVLSTAITSGQEDKKESATLAPSHEFMDSTAPTKTTTTVTTKKTTTTPPTTTKKTTTTPTTTTKKTTTTPTTTTKKTTTTPTTTTKKTTTTPTTTTKKTTTTPTTTTKKTTTTPTTTTKKTTTTPTTTTKKTTTTPTTTTKKTTPTTIKTTTAVPVPTPSTNVTKGNYSYSEGGKLLVMALTALQIRDDDKNGGLFIIQPNKTKSSGLVGKESVALTLTFPEGKIELTFKRNTTSKSVYVDSLSMDLKYAFQKGVMKTLTGKNSSLELFKAGIGRSYSCSNETVFLGNNLYVVFTQERVQAFNFTANSEFGPMDMCKADQPDYTVAIAVGIVLLILIIIVILAYICSRRRRSDGYQSL